MILERKSENQRYSMFNSVVVKCQVAHASSDETRLAILTMGVSHCAWTSISSWHNAVHRIQKNNLTASERQRRTCLADVWQASKG